MFSDFHFKRAKRVVGGQDEIVDIETGDELRRVTPVELACSVTTISRTTSTPATHRRNFWSTAPWARSTPDAAR
jgi:hypothetical protein